MTFQLTKEEIDLVIRGLRSPAPSGVSRDSSHSIQDSLESI
jgi:hypothetical protein